MLTASSVHAQRAVQVSPDGASLLISKPMDGQQWSIVVNFGTQTVVGNVFDFDGSNPQFVYCTILEPLIASPAAFATVESIVLDCHGSDGCGSFPCSPADWIDLGHVNVIASFFVPHEFGATLIVSDGRGTERDTFGIGQPVTFTMLVRNESGCTETISADGPPERFEVFRSGTDAPLWDSSQFSDGLIGIAVLLPPDAMPVPFADVWRQTDNAGNAVGPGSYEVRASLRVAACRNPCGLQRHEFAAQASAQVVIQ